MCYTHTHKKKKKQVEPMHQKAYVQLQKDTI